MVTTTTKWTVDEYHRMIDAGILDDKRVELLNGEIVEMAPEEEPHFFCRSEAGDYLTALLGDRAKVRQDGPITLPDRSEPEPDLAIVQPLGREYRQHHPYPENIFWLVEFSNSSLEKDTEIKRKTYGGEGIPEYWVVNLRTQELIVYRDPRGGDYQSKEILAKGLISPLAFPDVTISVETLLG